MKKKFIKLDLDITAVSMLDDFLANIQQREYNDDLAAVLLLVLKEFYEDYELYFLAKQAFKVKVRFSTAKALHLMLLHSSLDVRDDFGFIIRQELIHLLDSQTNTYEQTRKQKKKLLT
jgi:hypothetical protein